ncbi:hypothetical protein RFI_13435 [Reticulomyxa filosa]|uniref:Uncharacterized protein n=1 Tax=Reticulomyxa filosa TaxID=46433 RepID=X6ND96_RETFI|nr:hypothetical protein RFI_13435 [Reticulomyxa filosa]|eukprot:ETO23744.1 hypothetical protein RFI_13435 [Reticulomyxa filosa]
MFGFVHTISTKKKNKNKKESQKKEVVMKVLSYWCILDDIYLPSELIPIIFFYFSFVTCHNATAANKRGSIILQQKQTNKQTKTGWIDKDILCLGLKTDLHMTPQFIEDLSHLSIVKIACGEFHSCVVDLKLTKKSIFVYAYVSPFVFFNLFHHLANGDLYSFGFNRHGQFGIGVTVENKNKWKKKSVKKKMYTFENHNKG